MTVSSRSNKSGKSTGYTIEKLVAHIDPIESVSEGSIVHLDASRSYYNLQYKDSPVTKKKFKRSIGPEDGVSYKWKQVEGSEISGLNGFDGAHFMFEAPRIRFSNEATLLPYIQLKFDIIIQDNRNNKSTASVTVAVKMVQRALVLQGGGALGAYEVGALEAILKHVTRTIDSKRGIKERPIFDIIAGSSTGAANACIIIGSILEKIKDSGNDTSTSSKDLWDYSIKVLKRFWNAISTGMPSMPSNDYVSELSSLYNYNTEIRDRMTSAWWDNMKSLSESFSKYYTNFVGVNLSKENKQSALIPVWKDSFPFFSWRSLDDKWEEEMPYFMWYFYWPNRFSSMARWESARRYFSYMNSLIFGTPNVLSPAIFQPDMKYLSVFGFPFLRFSNIPLLATIKKYWDYDKFPIKTSFDKLEPRLLLVAVDVQNPSNPVVFDSYSYEGQTCLVCGAKLSNSRELKKHVNQNYNNSQDNNSKIDELRWTVYGNQKEKHVIFHEGINSQHLAASMSTHFMYKFQSLKATEIQLDSVINEVIGTKAVNRFFWDGAYLSNTPLRELLHAHQDYWYNQKSSIVPNLELYVVNLFPSVENELPDDPDSILDREMDIQFYDRTRVDIENASIIRDFWNLTHQIKKLALAHLPDSKEFEIDYNNFLDNTCKTKGRDGSKKTYRQLLEGSFEIDKLVYIDRRDDKNTMFAKVAEFSALTVSQLRKDGYRDAELVLLIEEIVAVLKSLSERNILPEDSNLQMQNIIRSILLNVKHEDVYSARNELSRFIEMANQTISGQSPDDYANLVSFSILVDVELTRIKGGLFLDLDKISKDQYQSLEVLLNNIIEDIIRKDLNYSYNTVNTTLSKALDDFD